MLDLGCKWFFVVGQIGLGINGSVVDVLVGIVLVRKFENTSGVVKHGKHCAHWITQVATPAGNRLICILQ